MAADLEAEKARQRRYVLFLLVLVAGDGMEGIADREVAAVRIAQARDAIRRLARRPSARGLALLRGRRPAGQAPQAGDESDESDSEMAGDARGSARRERLHDARRRWWCDQHRRTP